MANKDFVSTEEYLALWETLKGVRFVPKKAKYIVILVITAYFFLTFSFVFALYKLVRFFT